MKQSYFLHNMNTSTKFISVTQQKSVKIFFCVKSVKIFFYIIFFDYNTRASPRTHARAHAHTYTRDPPSY